MSLETDLPTYLLSKTAITNVVGTTLYQETIPQGVTGPAIAWSMSRPERLMCCAGAAGYAWATVQITCRSETNTQAFDLAESVRLVLHGFRGTIGSTIVGAIVFSDGDDDVENKGNSADSNYYFTVDRYRIGYAEAIPVFS